MSFIITEKSHSFRNKFARRIRKYSDKLRNETGIEAVSSSEFLMVCNAGLVSGIDREKIINVFSQYSSVRRVLMIPQKSYCFVQCVDEINARRALDAISGKVFFPELNGPLYLLYAERMPLENAEINLLRKPEGLLIIEEFINDSEEKFMIDFMSDEFRDSEDGTMKHRSVKHYGYEFDYKKNGVNLDNFFCKQIPKEWSFITKRLGNYDELKNWIPNQITVNKYEPGQGIPSHVDTHSCFDDFILSLSIGSDILMDFKNGQNQYSALLRRKSLLIMSDQARYGWSHGLTPRKYDTVEDENGDLTTQKRGQRISFTFRRIRNNYVCTCSFPHFCDSQKNVKKPENLLHINDTAASELERLHVHEVYDEIANHFSETRHKPWPNVENFVKSFEPGSVFIDIGCGNGKYFGLNPSIFQVGCDRSQKLSVECHKKDYEALRCDCIMLPFRSNIADYCVCIAVIHHLSTNERRIRAINEIARIVRPSGKALIYVWAKNQHQNKEPSSYLKQRNRNKKQTDELLVENSKYAIKLATSVAGSTKENDNNEISLPVHVNRTQFKYEDVLVPWKLHNGNNEKKFFRYYHVFEENELEALCQRVPQVDVIHSYYDQGN